MLDICFPKALSLGAPINNLKKQTNSLISLLIYVALQD